MSGDVVGHWQSHDASWIEPTGQETGHVHTVRPLTTESTNGARQEHVYVMPPVGIHTPPTLAPTGSQQRWSHADTPGAVHAAKAVAGTFVTAR